MMSTVVDIDQFKTIVQFAFKIPHMLRQLLRCSGTHKSMYNVYTLKEFT